MSQADLTGLSYERETLPVKELQVDPDVQRGLEIDKVRRIKDEFNEAALNTISVSKRVDKDGKTTLYVVDGQHRIRAVQELTDNTGTVPCHVYSGLDKAQEAALFLLLNNTSKPKVVDKFRISVVSGDTQAVAINGMVVAFGFKVSPNPRDGNVAAVRTLERLHKLSVKANMNPGLLQATLMVIRRAWGNDREGLRGPIMEGVGQLIYERRTSIDLAVLAEKLKQYAGGPYALLASATSTAKARRWPTWIAVADLVTDVYNKGQRGKALPAWTRRR